MAARGKVRRFFPGANTPKGFYSCFDYLLGPEATRIFVLKGGPGLGKSTFMKRIAEAVLEKGYDVEMHHCAADDSSIDAIVIPAIGVAMLDGTAPHVVDPKYPGCVDEIVNLGEFWDEEKMRAAKKQILRTDKEIGRSFARAYRYLRAAKAVHDDWESVYTESQNFAAVNTVTEGLIAEIFAGIAEAGRLGKQRHLFGSATSPDGVVNHLDTLIEPNKVKYVLKGDPGTGKSTLLTRVADAAAVRGYDAEILHCAFEPEKAEHVIIPKLSLALTVSAEPHLTRVKDAKRVIDLNECLEAENVGQSAGLVSYDRQLFFELLDQAVAALSRAKKLHDLMETYYVPNIDFAGINAVREKILARILRYAEEGK